MAGADANFEFSGQIPDKLVYLFVVMNIGFSLQLDDVLDTGTDVVESDFFKSVGEPMAFLSELRRNGVRSIELQHVVPGLSDDTILAAMQRIYVAGTHFTCLSSLPGGEKRASKAASVAFDAPPLSELRMFLNALGASPVMVVRSYNFPEASYEELATATVKGLRALIGNLKQHVLPFRVALEISRYRDTDIPGSSYEGLLEMGSHFSDEELGFCWDMGNTQASFLSKKLSETPPPEFVNRVIHTHIHDISPAGDTHQALRAPASYLEACIGCLKSNDYTGIYNLELYPDRWEPDVDVMKAIFFSVERLGEILRS